MNGSTGFVAVVLARYASLRRACPSKLYPTSATEGSAPAKRRADNAAVSSHAAGLDCSGFVSRCLKLPEVHDTTRLPSICTPLPATEIRPGDLLNIPHRHVLLCAGWATPDRKWIYFYETGGAPDYWKPGLKQAPLDALLALGYQPLRYRGMAAELRTDGKQVLTRAARAALDKKAEAALAEHGADGGPVAIQWQRRFAGAFAAGQQPVRRCGVVDIIMSHGADDTQLFSAGCQLGQMFADLQSGDCGTDGLKLAAEFQRRSRFHVPGVLLCRTTPHEQDDAGFGRPLRGCAGAFQSVTEDLRQRSAGGPAQQQ